MVGETRFRDFDRALHEPLRRAILIMWGIGLVFAFGTFLLALTKVGVGSAVPYLLATLLLVGLTLGTIRRTKWVLAVDMALLGLQVWGAVGSAIQLAQGISELKSAELEPLGIDPTTAVWANLLYSLVAFAIFAWFAWRWRELRLDRH